MKTTTNFTKARLGSVAMSACGACGQELGDVVIKSAGNPKGPEYIGPRLVAFGDARCEFCTFIASWMSHEGIEPGAKKCGASKVIERLPDDSYELVAYVPFTEDESEEERTKTLTDGTEFVLRHRTVVRAERDGDGMKLVELVDKGV